MELAQLEYELPRLHGHGVSLSRLGGGIGTRGPGEQKLEEDRRIIRKRAAELRRDIEAVRQQRAVHRQQRALDLIPNVAIVGYTNAGKSTLMNALSGAGIVAEDKLFATLDPTTRKVHLHGRQEMLFTDTVGFIQKLPTTLVAAFRATLEEVLEADALVHVVDITHPNAAEQAATVLATLEQLGAGGKPVVTALNKVDMLPKGALERAGLFPGAVAVSALRGVGLDQLLGAVERALGATMERVTVRLPFGREDLAALFHRRGIVEDERHTRAGTTLRGRVPRALLGMLGPYVVE